MSETSIYKWLGGKGRRANLSLLHRAAGYFGPRPQLQGPFAKGSIPSTSPPLSPFSSSNPFGELAGWGRPSPEPRAAARGTASAAAHPRSWLSLPRALLGNPEQHKEGGRAGAGQTRTTDQSYAQPPAPHLGKGLSSNPLCDEKLGGARGVSPSAL